MRDDVAVTIIELERAALDRWAGGDPDGFLNLSAPGVSYFDPYTRLNGIDALRSLYEGARGKISLKRFEIAEPRVQIAGDAAVLTFRFKAEGSDGSSDWNATEVYQRDSAGWKIIHTHWSQNKHAMPAETPDAQSA